MGAEYLVIGRSITHAADPIATLKQIQNRSTISIGNERMKVSIVGTGYVGLVTGACWPTWATT